MDCREKHKGEKKMRKSSRAQQEKKERWVEKKHDEGTD